MTVGVGAAKAVIYDVVAVDGGFAIHRNGAPLTTPNGAAFTVPTKVLAEAIATEWRAQGQKPNPASMPLNKLAATTIDIMSRKRGEAVTGIMRYADTDLLCHRADDSQSELLWRQNKVWQPLLEWCALRFNVLLRTGGGIMPVAQLPEATKALRAAIDVCDDFRLTGVQEAAGVSGSLVLALALAEGHLNAQQVFDAAELDASFQIEKWGEDPAATARREGVRRDLQACEDWFAKLDKRQD